MLMAAELLLQRRYCSILPRAVRQRSAGKVISYDFAEPMFGGHQQNSSPTATDVNEGRSWEHLLWQRRRHHFGKRRRCSGFVAHPRCLVVQVDIQSGERDFSGCGNSKATIEVASGR